MDRLRQRFAYLAFVVSTGKASAFTWYDKVDECSWTGVTCINQRFNTFRLLNRGLQGSIPADVGLWTSLRGFSIYDNQVGGTLPSSIGKWTNLDYIDVGINKLNGLIPTEVSNWKVIRAASFDGNQFSGTMPSMGRNFCPRNVTSLTTLLQADCKAPAEIVCQCCDSCCDATGNNCVTQR
jgi:hypothetical protein